MKKHKGNSFCESVATYMTSLLTKRDFAGVIRCYEANRSLVDEVGGTWGGSMLHQVAQAYASLTDCSAALKAARIAQAMATDDGDSLLLAEVFVTLGGILHDSSEHVEAAKAFRDAESIFRRNDCPEGQSRALNRLAGLYFRQTDYRNALSVLMDAIEIAKQLNDNEKLAYMMGNIGRLHTFMGNFAEAEKHLQINIDLSQGSGDELEIARARLSLAYVYIQQALYAQSEEELKQAYPLIVALNARREEVIYLTYLGEVLYRTSRFDDARDVLEKALALADKSASDTTLAGRVMRHLAELHVRTENFRQARRVAARSMVIMEKAGNRVETGALFKILAQVAVHNRQAAKARKLFMKAIDLLDESGVRWEKAEALVAAGSSTLFDERQRINYLFRAEEFYAGNRLDKKLENVSRLISELGTFAPTGKTARAVASSEDTPDYVTRCSQIKQFKSQLQMLGRTDLPVLITGETGVGKDHLARHFQSLVSPGGPFVAINCASVPETLLESELFGYCRGAFTGAHGNKKGLFVAADGGVLLLDEIGDMPLTLQAKLLGALETRKVLPLGGTSEVDIDIVLIATTNRNLEEMVEQGTFRRDLYYRLSGITFHLPPLRERKEDIPLLLEHFMVRCNLLSPGKKLPAELVRQFIDYAWPGNVRELANKVSRLEIMAQLVAEGDLVEITRSIFSTDKSVNNSRSLLDRVEEFERRLITEALLATGGNKSEAARMLGIHEATVRSKLKRYGIMLQRRTSEGLFTESTSSEGGAPN